MPRALVVGAGGAVGEAIAAGFLDLDWNVSASLHSARPEVALRLAERGAVVSREDLASVSPWRGERFDALVLTAHLERVVPALELADPGDAMVVVFSSNNVAVHAEAETYRALLVAEERVRKRWPNAAIIRPTLIYGDPRLATMTRVLKLARQMPVLPVPGSGRARVQPVFHEDLARVAIGVARARLGGVFAVGGPDIVTMRDLFEEAAAAVGARRWLAPTPAWLLRLAGFTREQVSRVERDRIAVDQTPAPDALTPTVNLRTGLRRLADTLWPSGLPRGG